MAAEFNTGKVVPIGVAGILLAAGRGRRFDPEGIHNKLLQPLSGGEPVVALAAKNLCSVIPRVFAIVRPGADDVAECLRRLGCQVGECRTADDGMAASLACGLSLVPDANGWVISLGDMPYVQPATIAALVDALADGADIAVPVFEARRGNPVAFSRRHLPRLLALKGDKGARDLLRDYPVVEVSTEDPGIHDDIDTVADIARRHSIMRRSG
ncbi:MAG TPA: nucleotidyltransferase family protein [Noviherbaspirillum sp.]|uniref:nucleotidyltransferase family protein n=1 Tax=Noviherbaspirillum sp. TaxID=1926288 RepID=UPI002DDC9D93|nr:nucleotidyltransferase family protein [Noviherbaspirillum sp.]HEV2612335.1 nucleotidyltransferase family protein [Noviherbaspirillum sp.]